MGEFLTENLTKMMILGFAVLFAWYSTRRPNGIPPGPNPVLPVLGNTLSMGGDQLKTFAKWRKKYGDIFSLYIGGQLVIVLNGYDVLKEALVKQGDDFTNRPNSYLLKAYFDGKGVAFSSGAIWKEQRLLTHSILKDFALRRHFLEDKINQEILVFLDVMKVNNGQTFDFTDLVQKTVFNILSSIVLGKRFEYDDPTFLTYLERIREIFEAVGNLMAVDFFPMLRYIPGDVLQFHKTMRNGDILDKTLYEPAVMEHMKKYDKNNINDFISAYIKKIKTRGKQEGENSINLDNLVMVVGDFFIQGMDTTVTTLGWSVMFLTWYPQVQEKCFQEIRNNVGLGRLPTMKDKLSLPYVEATITEIQRLSDIMPLATCHTVSETLIFMGYTIQKGVHIIPNLSSVLKDPNLFENPDLFKPERFLDSNGKVVKREEFIPFSMGKRNCAGESLAKMQLFLLLTAMIQRLKFTQPDFKSLPPLVALKGASPDWFSFVATVRTEELNPI